MNKDKWNQLEDRWAPIIIALLFALVLGALSHDSLMIQHYP